MKTELIATGSRITLYYHIDDNILTICDWSDEIMLTKSETIELRDFLNQLDLTD